MLRLDHCDVHPRRGVKVLCNVCPEVRFKDYCRLDNEMYKRLVIEDRLRRDTARKAAKKRSMKIHHPGAMMPYFVVEI